jgi:nucleoporin p58/p45
LVPNDVDFISRKLAAVESALENDAQAISHVRASVKKDQNDARLLFGAIDNLKLPAQYHHYGLWNTPSTTPSESADDGDGGARDLVSYFSQYVDGMSKTLAKYQSNMAEIEAHLKGVEANILQQIQQLMLTGGSDGTSRSAEDQVRELAAVLGEFENGILGVAGKVGAAREGVQELILGKVVGGGPSARKNASRGRIY